MDVLIVEDDEAIAEPLSKGLLREGFAVRRVGTGAAAITADPGDVVILDLGLPDMDGLDVCRALRARSSVPIIIVTARGEEIDRVVGLEIGADDYMVKPFGFRELIARIRAVTRRSDRRGDDRRALEVGPVSIDLRSHRVVVNGAEIALTPKEYDLLVFLASEPGAVRTRTEILEEVWDSHWYGPTKTLDVHVASLRRKLGVASLISTVRGVGFRLESTP